MEKEEMKTIIRQIGKEAESGLYDYQEAFERLEQAFLDYID